mgnify:CR=1 FL=1
MRLHRSGSIRPGLHDPLSLIHSFSIPPAEYGAKCKACSLREHCLPSVQRSASGYCMQLRKEAMHEEDVP